MGVQVTWDHIFGAVVWKFRSRVQGATEWALKYIPFHGAVAEVGDQGMAEGKELEFQVAGCNGYYCGNWSGE
jgi:hypothetical protein